jgi:hypothetical protein
MTSDNPKPYTRRLSGLERYSLAINELYRYNIDAIAEGTGNISLEELQNAVTLAAEANPGARVRLRSFLGFSKWVDSGIAPIIKEIEAPEWDCYSERGSDFLEEGFHPRQGGPVLDGFLIQGNPIRIIFRVLHAAMDARGLQHFAKDVFRILRGEPPIGSHSSLTDVEVTSKFTDKIKDVPAEAVCIPVLSPSSGSHRMHYVWRRVILNKNISYMLPKMAVFLAQHGRKTNQGTEGKVGFTIPVDLRGLREDVVTTANMTGYMRVYIAPEDTAKMVMQQINQNVRNYVDCALPNILKKLPWVPIALMLHQMRKGVDKALYETNKALPSGGIVSLGMFKPEEFSCPQFKATTCTGIPGSVGKMNVVIMNYTDHTEVIFSTPEAFNMDGQLDQMISEFKQYFEG